MTSMGILDALPIVGDLIGAAAQRNANRENRLMQEKFASHGVRMRVEDAKAAGVHPLFALGASVPSFSPSAQPIFDSASLGQNIARAATQFSTEERELRSAQLEAVRAGTARDYAQAAAFASEAKRAQQEQNVSLPVAQSFPVIGHPDVDSRTVIDGQTVQLGGTHFRELGPPPGRVPSYLNPEGPRFAFRQWSVPGLGEVILPDASNFSEALEALENPINQSAVVAANLVHYGPAGRAKLEKYLKSRGLWKLYSDPGGALVDSIRSFGERRSQYRE